MSLTCRSGSVACFAATLLLISLAGCSSNSDSQVGDAGKLTAAETAALTAKTETTATDAKEETAPTGKHKSRRPASAAKGNVYVVQVGAFHEKENAEHLYKKLLADGFPVIMEPLQHSTNGLLYLVRMKPYNAKAEALSLRDDLKTKTELDAVILSLPSVDTSAATASEAHEEETTKATASSGAATEGAHAPASTN